MASTLALLMEIKPKYFQPILDKHQNLIEVRQIKKDTISKLKSIAYGGIKIIKNSLQQVQMEES